MYIIKLTWYESKGIYAEPRDVLKWGAESEEEANQFMEKVINLLDMSPYGDNFWFKDIGSSSELFLEMEPLDAVTLNDLSETLKDYVNHIVNPEYL